MKLCITGGGTGGHLMVARALADTAVAEGHEVIFIGSTNGQDRKYFGGRSSFSEVYFLNTTGVVNQKGSGKLKAIVKMLKAYLSAREILSKHKIQAVYSVGGYSAAPAAFATVTKFLPLFIHEQNAVTGRLNALLKPFAKNFVSAYDNKSNIQGYPVEETFFKNARVRDEVKTIIFLGGSHGAMSVNDLALSCALELQDNGFKIIHQCGEFDYERVKDEYEILGVEVELYGFTNDLAEILSRADLAVSRAGASTLWELSANGLPAFFIPYPYAAGDHQYYNAQFIVENELGWCEREGEELKQKFLAVTEESMKEKSEKLLSYTSKDVARAMIADLQKRVK